MGSLQFFIVVVSGTGGLVLSFMGLQRAACLVGMVGQPFWLVHTWHGPQEFFIVSVSATAAWAVGILLHWVRPWWAGRSERRRQRLRRASW
ncbi:MAG: hypothetical protein V4505_25505 [Pseudomonadota bacterium]